MQFPLYIIDGIYPLTRFNSGPSSQEELHKIVFSERREELVVLKYDRNDDYYHAIYTVCPGFGFMPNCNTHQLTYGVGGVNSRLHFHTQEEFDNFLLLYAL